MLCKIAQSKGGGGGAEKLICHIIHVLSIQKKSCGHMISTTKNKSFNLPEKTTKFFLVLDALKDAFREAFKDTFKDTFKDA